MASSNRTPLPLPQDIKALLVKREWNNIQQLKARMLGHKPYPIVISLKLPTGKEVLQDINAFKEYIQAWRKYPKPNQVIWESKNYRVLSKQQVPRYFKLESLNALIDFIGPQARTRYNQWADKMAPLLLLSSKLYETCIKHLERLESLDISESKLLAKLVGQLKVQMGDGCYLRALPLIGIDTKFLENHEVFVSDAVSVLQGVILSSQGGLRRWLGCCENPKGWLTVRPLCSSVQERLGGFSILQLPISQLERQPLQAKRVLVVENMQSGLGLPELDDTVAVFGGGKNVSWLQAYWLSTKQVGYWGDIDSWGLEILSQARAKCPGIKSIMMDLHTLKQHESRMVIEKKSVEAIPSQLTEAEAKLFIALKANEYEGTRLEQERLSPDYIQQQLTLWLKKGLSTLL